MNDVEQIYVVRKGGPYEDRHPVKAFQSEEDAERFASDLRDNLTYRDGSGVFSEGLYDEGGFRTTVTVDEVPLGNQSVDTERGRDE